MSLQSRRYLVSILSRSNSGAHSRMTYIKESVNIEAWSIAWKDAQRDMDRRGTQQRLDFEMKAKVEIKCVCSSSAGRKACLFDPGKWTGVG